ncbi:hypothetical protein D3C78_1951150 [compost metagenome]
MAEVSSSFWVMWLAATSRARSWRCSGFLRNTPRALLFLKIMCAALKQSRATAWLSRK